MEIDIKKIISLHNKEIGNIYNKYPKDTRVSISQVKDSLAIEFDRERVALKTYNDHHEDKDSIYFKKSVDEIIEMWDAKSESSKRMGNLVDDFIGLAYNQWESEDKPSKDLADKLYENAGDNVKKKYEGVRRALKEFKDNNLKFECREMPLYLRYPYKKKTWLVNGRFDAIFSNAKQLLVVDWKNSEEIKDRNPWQKMLGPCKAFDDCDLIKFTIQVYLYIYILKHEYGVNVPMSSCIVQFPAQKDYFYKIFMPGFTYSDELMQKIIEYSIDKRIEEFKDKKKKKKEMEP